MKFLFASIVLVLMIAAVVVGGCKKQQDTLSLDTLNDYFPLQIGRSYIYRVDSSLPAGTAFITRSYLVKDSIESSFTDNQGHLSYRIFRFITDTANVQPWQSNNTFFATATENRLEYVENNLRFIKLRLPVKEGYTWQGNSYIETSVPVLSYLDGWEYQYQNVGKDYSVLSKAYNNTVTVFQRDELSPDLPFDPNNFQQRNYSIEVYAKGIGLIYKDILHWTWQPSRGVFSNDPNDDISFGETMRLISHN